jgi:ribosomal protein L11 methyltransferase
MSELPGEKVEMILANINKNVLLKEIPHYSSRLLENGLLFLSGFYTEDISDLEVLAKENGFVPLDFSSHDNWACLVFKKTS